MRISNLKYAGYSTLKQNDEKPNRQNSSMHLDAVCCFFFLPLHNPVSVYNLLRNTQTLPMPTAAQMRRHHNDRFMFAYVFVRLK